MRRPSNLVRPFNLRPVILRLFPTERRVGRRSNSFPRLPSMSAPHPETDMQPIRSIKQAGLTLVELMFAVAIVAVLASIASTSVFAAVHAARGSDGLASLVASLTRAAQQRSKCGSGSRALPEPRRRILRGRRSLGKRLDCVRRHSRHRRTRTRRTDPATPERAAAESASRQHQGANAPPLSTERRQCRQQCHLHSL